MRVLNVRARGRATRDPTRREALALGHFDLLKLHGRYELNS